MTAGGGALKDITTPNHKKNAEHTGGIATDFAPDYILFMIAVEAFDPGGRVVHDDYFVGDIDKIFKAH